MKVQKVEFYVPLIYTTKACDFLGRDYLLGLLEKLSNNPKTRI